jgi:hypothetical protein
MSLSLPLPMPTTAPTPAARAARMPTGASSKGVDVDSFRAGQIRLWMRFSVHNIIGRHDDGSGDAGSGEP